LMLERKDGAMFMCIQCKLYVFFEIYFLLTICNKVKSAIDKP